MSDILSYAKISVEVLNDQCWQNCDEFDPFLSSVFYAYDHEITARHFECKNLEKCKRLYAQLERSEK